MIEINKNLVDYLNEQTTMLLSNNSENICLDFFNINSESIGFDIPIEIFNDIELLIDFIKADFEEFKKYLSDTHHKLFYDILNIIETSPMNRRIKIDRILL